MSEFENFVDWLDLDNVDAQGGGGNPPELGTHLFEIVDFEKKASSKGKAQVRVSFRCESENESKGRRISGWYTLDPTVTAFEKGRTKQLLVAAGLPTKGFNLDQLKGKRIIGDVTDRMIDNKEAGKLGPDGKPLPAKIMFRGISNERAA